MIDFIGTTQSRSKDIARETPQRSTIRLIQEVLKKLEVIFTIHIAMEGTRQRAEWLRFAKQIGCEGQEARS